MALIEAQIYPPVDDLLFLQRQHKHRIVVVYEGNPEEEYDFRRRDKGLFDLIRNEDPHPQVWEHLHNVGFGGVFQCGWRRFDHGLLTALIERWRPETHTFHFPVGEATITLQDVQVLWGLPINGPAVTGKWESRPKTDWVTICVDWLGFLLEERRVRGGAIDINYLIDVLEQQPVDVNNPLSLEKRARLYILALLGGCLFSDSSSRGVSLNYVTNIMDLTVAGRKSWGSATLSHLYRQLCKAATIKGEALIAGPLMLVMVWAWERMIDIAPRNRNVTYAYNKPYAARWSGLEAHLSYSDTPQHAVRLSRMMITAMEPNKFDWTPYVDVIDILPEECRRDRGMWTYMGWLINWHVVEPHLPNRVKRQFGWMQDIPDRDYLFDDCRSLEDHHKVTRTGRHRTNWETEHHAFIQVWNNRGNLVLRGEGPFVIVK